MARIHSLFALVSGVAVSTILASSAQAQVPVPTYYTRAQIDSCGSAAPAATGALAGGAAGALAGAVLSGGRAGGTIAGAITGSIAGAIIGQASSCQDRMAYMGQMDDFLYRPNYWQPYNSDNAHIFVLRSGYGPHGEVCRTMHVEQVLVNGQWATDESTACYDRGARVWNYGFPASYINQPTWINPQPAIFHPFVAMPIGGWRPIVWSGGFRGPGYGPGFVGPRPFGGPPNIIGMGPGPRGPGYREVAHHDTRILENQLGHDRYIPEHEHLAAPEPAPGVGVPARGGGFSR